MQLEECITLANSTPEKFFKKSQATWRMLSDSTPQFFTTLLQKKVAGVLEAIESVNAVTY